MSLITDTWRQLVRRRLWPVALGLLAALAAVPVVLAREPEVAPSPAKAQAATAGAEVTDPVVALAGESPKDARRRVLGESKDPFTPAPSHKSKKSAKAAQNEPAAGTESSPADSSGGAGAVDGSGGSSGGGDSVEPVFELPDLDDPDTPEVTYPRYSLSVRFGGGDEEPQEDVIERGEALPSEDDPVAIYLGVSKDGKRAVFMLDARRDDRGRRHLHAEPRATARRSSWHAGETEFFDVADEDGKVRAVPARRGQDPQGQGRQRRRRRKTAKAGAAHACGRARAALPLRRPHGHAWSRSAAAASRTRAGVAAQRLQPLAPPTGDAGPPAAARKLPGVSLRVITAG